MPTNGRRAIGKGELRINVMDYGAVGDSNSTGSTGTDDLAAIHTAAAAALSEGRPLWFPKVTNGYRAVGTIDLPGGIDVQMDSPVITPASVTGIGLRYNGSGTYVRKVNLVLRQRRGVVTNWGSESDIGIQTRNVQESIIRIGEASNNTIGYQRLGDNSGHVENETTLVTILNNKVGVDCETIGTGWVNEENTYGGHFSVDSTVNTTTTRYGIRIRSSAGYLCNAHVYYKPAIEIGVGITGGAEAIPILVADGIVNKFLNVRNEGNGNTVIRTTGVAQDNYASTTYGTAFEVKDDQGSYPTTELQSGRNRWREQAQRTVFRAHALHLAAVPYDATQTNIPGMVLGTSANANRFRQQSGIAITPTYLEVTNRTIGKMVDTTTVKSFVLSMETETGFAGRQLVRCYDSAGAVMDPALYTSNPLVRKVSSRGVAAVTSYGGAYATGSDDATPMFFRVADSVKSIYVGVTGGTAALRIRSFRLLTDDVFLPTAWSIYPENETEPLATQAPNAGLFNAGRRIGNGAPASGAPSAWVCSTTGGASSAAWAASTVTTANTWVRSATGGRVWQAAVAGTTAAGSEPASFSTGAVGDTLVDGTVTWVCRATTQAVFKPLANIP